MAKPRPAAGEGGTVPDRGRQRGWRRVQAWMHNPGPQRWLGSHPWWVSSALVALLIWLADPLLHRLEFITFDMVTDLPGFWL